MCNQVMMSRILFTVFLMMPVLGIADAWNVAIGGGKRSEYGLVIREAPGGDFFAAGKALSLRHGPGHSDGFIVRLNRNGAIVWRKRIPNAPVNELFTRKTSLLLSAGGVLIQMDHQGRLQWSKSYGKDLVISAVTPTKSGYLLALEKWPQGAVFYVVSITHQGDIRWSKKYSASRCEGCCPSEIPEALTKTADGGYLLSIVSQCTSSLRLIKLNASGEVQWERGFNICPTGMKSLSRTSDGGYILGMNFYTRDLLTLFMKVDSAGNLRWNQMYTEGWGVRPVYHLLSSIFEIPDGYVALRDDGFFKLDFFGNIVNAVAPPLSRRSTTAVLYDLRPTKDGEYIAAGILKQPRIAADAWFIKFNQLFQAPFSPCMDTQPARIPASAGSPVKQITSVPLTSSDTVVKSRHVDVNLTEFVGNSIQCGN